MLIKRSPMRSLLKHSSLKALVRAVVALLPVDLKRKRRTEVAHWEIAMLVDLVKLVDFNKVAIWQLQLLALLNTSHKHLPLAMAHPQSSIPDKATHHQSDLVLKWLETYSKNPKIKTIKVPQDLALHLYTLLVELVELPRDNHLWSKMMKKNL